MPFTSSELQDAQKITLDFFLKNKPIDQIGVERPLLKALMPKRKAFPGAKQYVVVQLMYQFQSNFTWFNGAQQVSYNRRQPINQANYPWRSAHDGYALDEDRLIQNGVSVTDSGPGGKASKAEIIQLNDLLEVQNMALRKGFEEKFSHSLHLDGSSSTDALAGMDALVSLTPTAGLLGGIDRAVNVWWRNHAATGLTTTTTTGNILEKMETAWKACVRNGGQPNLIIAGTLFHDGLRNFLMNTYGQLNFHGAEEREFEAGTKMLSFHGVPVIWSPEFADLDTLYAPATAWEKRCYMVNTDYLTLKPIEGQDMITRKPPRPYDRYEWYTAMTWRGALCLSRANSAAVLAIA